MKERGRERERERERELKRESLFGKCVNYSTHQEINTSVICQDYGKICLLNNKNIDVLHVSADVCVQTS